MNIAVCVKQAVDESELRPDQSGSLDASSSPTKMSTFDKNAVEEAVRLKAAKGGTVTIVTLGTPDSKKTMKEALAIGADRGVLVTTKSEANDTLTTSQYLAKVLQKTGPFDLIICSEGSSDIYTGQVPPMVAEWMNLPFVGYVRKLDVTETKISCERSLEDRVDVVESPLPAVVSVVSEINEPRYPTLLQIMQAGKKPVEEIGPEQLGEEEPVASVKASVAKAQSMNRKRILFEGPAPETARKLLDALAAEGVL